MSEEKNKNKMTRRDMIKAMGLTAGALGLDPSLVQGSDKEENMAKDKTVEAASAIASEQTTEQAGTIPPVDEGDYLTNNQGVRISDDQNSLRAGVRGPSLLEDFQFREKMTHFDHERIPERVVHARGAGAHGFFQVYKSLAQYTRAQVFQDPSVQTPVFVRFSTVNGARGSADTARDARGFATKFYTQEGVWDLVGNNIPVFFIQDAIKFPDLVHAFKPEPHHEIPQASTAHDNFWDFISLTPESMHMIMWAMSDRGIPRSYRMQEGFGVHTFRLVNAQGNSTYVKFHWKPLLGVHSLVWDEAQKLGGKDPDFHRRDLWDAIEAGNYPEYELGMQLFDDATADKFSFDILDATKLVPEDLVPVLRVGKMTLNKNPDNYFAETEQVAFHTAHVVSGIDFTNDPLLQGRNFSYLDTQINRFGGPNFHQVPINQAKSPVNNYQQDSFMRYANRPGKINYEPNSLGGNAKEAPSDQGGYVSFGEQINGAKVRQRSDSFADHFTQATMFFNSMTDVEKQHITQALQFELAKVTVKEVQQRVIDLLANVDTKLAQDVAGDLSLTPKAGKVNANAGKAKALSQLETVMDTVKSRKIAILTADGANAADIAQMQTALKNAGATAEVIAPHLGTLKSVDGQAITVNQRLLDVASVLYDAVYVPGGADAINTLKTNGAALLFIQEAYKHYKAVAFSGEGATLFTTALGEKAASAPGVVSGQNGSAVTQNFINAIAKHRAWDRPDTSAIAA
ncbi:catalase [soil metagenome]